ncbi:MAG: hypothetical protein K2N95_01900 [Lachnospiraceae bacterium]|nr:hypothetical protein [Lachnospiraceae bacterium]
MDLWYKTWGMNMTATYNVWKEEFGGRYNQEELREYTKELLIHEGYFEQGGLKNV